MFSFRFCHDEVEDFWEANQEQYHKAFCCFLNIKQPCCQHNECPDGEIQKTEHRSRHDFLFSLLEFVFLINSQDSLNITNQQ